MTKHPCAGRSQAAIDTFEAIAIGQQPTYHPRTIQALLEAGLIEKVGERTVGRDMLGAVKIPIFQVPLNIHYQWCRWCSENLDDDSMDEPVSDGSS